MNTKPLLASLATLAAPAKAHACFSGYFAPSFLDVTNPVIGSGVVFLMGALILNVLRKRTYVALAMPVLYLAISYYGHWSYAGDCGYQIVALNRVATIISFAWLIHEVTMFYRWHRKQAA